jgi:nucleoside 2-deoxyribosyltransferase
MKIYLAGPDVFRPDVHEWAETARATCSRYGYEALIPIDHGETEANRIFQTNLDLIRKAQIIVANLNPFRGTEPDSGTCFEMGYAIYSWLARTHRWLNFRPHKTPAALLEGR